MLFHLPSGVVDRQILVTAEAAAAASIESKKNGGDGAVVASLAVTVIAHSVPELGTGRPHRVIC